jgi:hypothetical protein
MQSVTGTKRIILGMGSRTASFAGISSIIRKAKSRLDRVPSIAYIQGAYI